MYVCTPKNIFDELRPNIHFNWTYQNSKQI